MAKKAVTQSRIADALGVSRNTVSKALNNEVGVSEELRKKIRDTAIEMGYNKLIVLDEKGGIYKKNIALVCIGNALVDSYWNTFIVALDKRLKSLNYNMTLCFLEEEDDKNLRIPENLSSSYVAGIVFIGVCTKAFAKKMMQLKIPTVFIDTFWDVDINNLFSDTLLIDNYHSVYEITTRLIKDGHKRIGFLGDIYTCKSYYERFLGFRDALLDNKREYDKKLCAIGENVAGTYTDEDYFYKVFRAMDIKPTAMVCCNDRYAMQFMISIKSEGYLVPEDIAVAGFDNLKESTYFYPTLTTVEGNRAQLGNRAAEQIVKRINSPDEQFELVRLQATPIFRDSTKRK
ncbi:LacI family DNA-binding transcriptional regulator [Pseudobutyrivibrio sp.]